MTGVNCTNTVRQLNLKKVLQNQHYLTGDAAFVRSKTWTRTSFSLQAPLEPGLCNYRYCRWWKAEGTIYFLVADQKYSRGFKKKSLLFALVSVCPPQHILWLLGNGQVFRKLTPSSRAKFSVGTTPPTLMVLSQQKIWLKMLSDQLVCPQTPRSSEIFSTV